MGLQNQAFICAVENKSGTKPKSFHDQIFLTFLIFFSLQNPQKFNKKPKILFEKSFLKKNMKATIWKI